MVRVLVRMMVIGLTLTASTRITRKLMVSLDAIRALRRGEVLGVRGHNTMLSLSSLFVYICSAISGHRTNDVQNRNSPDNNFKSVVVKLRHRLKGP